MKVCVIGATGYTGMLLLRLLQRHEKVEQILPVSSSKPGVPVNSEDPGLGQYLPKMDLCGQKFLTVEEAAQFKPDVVFAALPHLASASVCAPFFGKSVVIDLSADFRIKDRGIFYQAYGQEPPRPDLLDQAVFGLAEWHTQAIKTADIIANPGCYPTCSLLPLLPLYKEGILKGRAIINASSGVSGAGKKVDPKYLYAERTESVQAYSPGRKHRHSQEIEVELGFAAPGTRVIFNPHLAPMRRGMASTITVDLAPGKTLQDAKTAWKQYYQGRPFVQPVDRIPATSEVWGSNRCDFAVHQEEETLIIMSVIDNLMKGASGQAVQNMNIRFGFDETTGLSLTGEI